MNEVSRPAGLAHKMAAGPCPPVSPWPPEPELELLSELGSFMLLGLDF